MLAAFVVTFALIVPVVAHADAQTGPAVSAHLGDRTLRPGDHGDAVKALQQLLARAGFKTPADGAYGRGTVVVVRRFQRVARLKVTGVADRPTIAALRRATSGTVARSTTGGYDGTSTRHLGDRIPLEHGMSGHDVRILQDFLGRLGFKVTIDGEFGAGTLRAVKAFETQQHRPVDGVLDAGDIDALRNLAGRSASTRTAPATAPGDKATVGSDGLATAPASAPDAVKQIIAAGNAIAKKPYIYGGGHGSWNADGYDCSGSVSYALHGAGLLKAPLTSGDFESWGQRGPGQWVTIYANGGHVYMVVAGLRFDTSGRQQAGTRWQAASRSGDGYTVVHPTGL